MKRSKSSKAWLKEHFDDVYVKRAQQEGYRSRAVYKLEELDRRDRLLRPGLRVVDLGAAPGGWSQYAAAHVGRNGRIVASDILPMDPIAGVEFVQGDFTEEAVLQQILAQLGDKGAELVISDMAPNISGIGSSDQARAMYLAELAWDFAQKVLLPGGDLVIKVFQGQGYPELYRALQPRFERLAARKPQASRARSREVYVVGKGFRD